MIRYNKKLSVSKNQDNWFIETDRGDRYEMFLVKSQTTPWSEWWAMNHQSDLRLWQKDIIRDFATHIPGLIPMLVYKRNQGHSQPHDICIAYSEETNLWFISTQRDFWIIENAYGQFEFNVEQSLGSVLEPEDRHQMYLVLEAFERAS